MTLLLIVSIGILALKRFENANLEKKLWNLPIIIIIVLFWPFLIMGLKNLIDTFNTFLINDVFQIPWLGFGFPAVGSVTHIMGWTADGLARLLPSLAYWIVYAFYIIFFFFFAVLGPFILAIGILSDEIDAFLSLLKEIVILFLWQTMMVILVAFIMPVIVSGDPFPSNPPTNFYFLSFILGIMILFVPSMTRKFTSHLGGGIFPKVFKFGGAALALTGIGKVGALGLGAIGADASKASLMIEPWLRRAGNIDDFKSKYQNLKELQRTEDESNTYQSKFQEQQDIDLYYGRKNGEAQSKREADVLFGLLKKAKVETQNDGGGTRRGKS